MLNYDSLFFRSPYRLQNGDYMDFTYRQSKSTELPLIIDFINYVFSYDHYPHDFKKMVPKVYGDNPHDNAIHFIALNNSNQIIGVVGILPIKLHIHETVLKCGFIGSVSVHPYYRSKGHMKKLMETADNYLMANSFDMGILDGLRQRYEYYGYKKSGISMCFEITSDNIRHGLKNIPTKDFNIISINHNDDILLNNIFDLISQQPVYVERCRDTLLYAMNNFENTLYAVTFKNNFIGYFTASKDNFVTEINARNKNYYSNIIKLWMDFSKTSYIRVTALPHQTDLLSVLQSFSENILVKYGDSFKIFNNKKSLNAIKEYNNYLPSGISKMFAVPFSLNIADIF